MHAITRLSGITYGLLAGLATAALAAGPPSQAASQSSSTDTPFVTWAELAVITNDEEGVEPWEVEGLMAGRPPGTPHPYFALIKLNKLIWARSAPFSVGKTYRAGYGFAYRIRSGPFVGRGGQDRWIAEIVESGGWPAVGATIVVGGTPAAPMINPDGLSSPIRP